MPSIAACGGVRAGAAQIVFDAESVVAQSVQIHNTWGLPHICALKDQETAKGRGHVRFVLRRLILVMSLVGGGCPSVAQDLSLDEAESLLRRSVPATSDCRRNESELTCRYTKDQQPGSYNQRFSYHPRGDVTWRFAFNINDDYREYDQRLGQALSIVKGLAFNNEQINKCLGFGDPRGYPRESYPYGKTQVVKVANRQYVLECLYDLGTDSIPRGNGSVLRLRIKNIQMSVRKTGAAPMPRAGSDMKPGQGVPDQRESAGTHPDVARVLQARSGRDRLNFSGTSIVSNYAVQKYTYRDSGGTAVLRYTPSKGWEVVFGGGGALTAAELTSQFGIPKEIADKLCPGRWC